MSVVACGMYRVTCHKDAILPVLTELELLQSMEPVAPLFPLKIDAYTALKQSVTSQREQLQKAIAILASYSPSSISKNILITPGVVEKITKKHEELRSVVEEVVASAEALEQIQNHVAAVQTQLERLELVKKNDLPIFVANTGLVNSAVLSIDVAYFPTVERELATTASVEMSTVAQTDEKVVVALVYEAELQAKITELIEQPYCQEIRLLDDVDAEQISSLADLYSHYETQKDAPADRVVLFRETLEKYATRHLPLLSAWHDMVLLQEDSLASLSYVGYFPDSPEHSRSISNEEQDFLQSQSTDTDSVMHSFTTTELVHIDGWVDPSQVELLTRKLKKVDSQVTVKKLDASNDPEMRTVLSNSRLFRPFELITNLMGMPNPQEIDPSPYVAPFFILFFGFALGDAGYGLLMVLAALYFYQKREQYTRQLRNAIGLIMFCGLSTTFFGVITGSWFGIDLAAIGPIGQSLASLKVLDLPSNIILLLISSLVLGFIHQLFALTLAIYGSVKAGHWSEALQVPGTWLLLLLSLAFFAAARSVPGMESFAEASTTGVLISGILFILGQGYGSVWYIRPLKGFASIFNLTGYISNTLSYARLLALALATGVIASVVNMIALMAAGELPLIIAVPIIAVVALIGHTFNIVLNLLGTFINVARLHLVEFFPRFFEAKGVGLSPLQTESVYSLFSDTVSGSDLALRLETVSKEK